MEETHTHPNPTPTHTFPILNLPLELRLQIYKHIFSASTTLTIRSLFIRTNFRNTFMTQQPKQGLTPAVLLANKQIYIEARPILYAGPTWLCGCRVEALANQIGPGNFRLIRSMGVDVDDLDLIVECARRERQKAVHRGSGYAMQEIAVAVPDALRGSSRGPVGRAMGPKGLDFSGLEVLEVEGYQSAALSSRGSHRVRVEALRLCEFASQLVGFHPLLKVLLQRGGCWDGGSDARDLTLGRVKWRFVRERGVDGGGLEAGKGKGRAGLIGDRGEGEEHVVDLDLIRSMLEVMLREDERAVELESSLPVAWTSSGTGRFNLYPYLQAARV